MKSFVINTTSQGRIEFNFDNLTQMCGKNTNLKKMIFKVIKNHFSRKISQNDIENVILLDNEEIGGSYFNHLYIYDEKDLIDQLSFVKDSILFDYIKGACNKTEFVDLLYEINESLLKINQHITSLSNEIFNKTFSLENKEFQLSDYLKSISICGIDDDDIIGQSNFERLLLYFKLIKKKIFDNPGNYLISFWDIDKLISSSELINLYDYMKDLIDNFGVNFIVYSSSSGFLLDPVENLESVNIVNNILFPFCSFDILKESLERNYPTNITFDREYLTGFLNMCSVDLFSNIYIYGYSKYDVIIKVLNSIYGIDCSFDKGEQINDLELSYLRSGGGDLRF